MTHRRARTGFSLLELMIAIIIFGLGMVMVATIFPIGLDISRDAIQQSISQAVTDTAVAILKIKVPGFEELDQIGVANNPNVQAPPIMDENAVEKLPPLPFPNDRRYFTKVSAWDGDDGNLWQTTFIMSTQNVPANYASLSLAAIPTELPPRIGTSSPPDTRIHLADRVYPPVQVEFGFYGPPPAPPQPDIAFGPNGVPDGMYVPTPGDQGLLYPDIIREAATRRYAWAAIHHRRSAQPEEISQFIATIVVLHRADMNARYAAQWCPNWPLSRGFNLADPDDVAALRNPVPWDAGNPPPAMDDPATPWRDDDPDTLFPQAWLVMLDNVNLSTGTVTCRHGAARVLPEGAFFFVAQRKGGLYAGTFYEIITASWDDPDEKVTLQIAGGGSGSGDDVLVWVFPPPIVARGDSSNEIPPTFGARSPVVDPPSIRSVP